MPTYYYRDQLESERLITRFLTAADAAIWTSFFEDAESTRFVNIDLPTARDKSVFWMEKQLDRYAGNRYGLQALIDKRSGDFVGQCGLLLQEVDGKPELEVGYHILKQYWGKGYAPEAARLFLDFGFMHQLSPEIISIIHVDNFKSQRVADKNGLSRRRQTTWNNKDVFIYGIIKKD